MKINVLVSQISSLVWGYVFIKFMDLIYTRKYANKRIYLIYWAVFSTISLLINYISVPLMNTLVIYILFIVGAILLYERRGRSFLLYNTYFMAFMISLEMLSVIIFTYILPVKISEVLDNNFYMLITGMPVLLLGISLYPVIAKLFQRQKISHIRLIENLLFVGFVVFQMIVITYILLLGKNRTDYNMQLLVIGGFLVFDFAFIYIFNYISAVNEYKQNELLVEQQKKMTTRYYEEAENKYTRLRKLVHDINRHLGLIQGLILDGNIDEAKNYLYGIEKRLTNFERTFHYKNRVLNLLINEKYNLCISKGIQMTVNVQDIPMEYLDEFDITTILSNLIDNAFDECMQKEIGSFIEIRLFEFNNMLMIMVENSFNNQKTRYGGIGKSSKTGHEGYGLLNVEEAVSLYGGRMKIEKTEELFRVKINIPY